MAAVVAIIAAAVSAITAGVAFWQARSAHTQAAAARTQAVEATRSADIAEKALTNSEQQTVAAQTAAAAAERQANEARQQNQHTEELLALTRQQLEAERADQYQIQTVANVRNVHELLLAAAAVREELIGNLESALERQEKDAWEFHPLVYNQRSEERWEQAVNTVRVERPPASDLNAAIGRYAELVTKFSGAVNDADDLSHDRKLNEQQVSAVVAIGMKLKASYDDLAQACEEFFDASGLNPNDDLTAT